MEFEREIHEQYQKAYALGMKNLQDKKKQRLAVCPAALNTLLDEKMVGKFYVVDGKKRVSAVKAQGTVMIDAQVTRILPVETDDPEIQSYYEFVKTYEKTGLYQIAFTQPGKADSFLKAMGYEPDHTWSEMDRFSFMFHWYPFDRAMKVAFDNQLNITTADAVLVLLRNHSIAELRNLPSWVLAEMMQDVSDDLCKIGNCDIIPRKSFFKKAS